MGTHRPAYIAIFVAASLVAAGVYWFAQPRAEAVRARADIPLLTPITAEMVELVQVPPAARPADTATSLDAVVGLYAAAPILAGQYLDTRALEATPGQRTFGFGAALPAGHVAFALPVEPGQALGSVVTSDLAALLVYGGVRTARRRLGRLVSEGLLRGYWAANSQRPRGRYAYSLLGPVRDALAERVGEAASRRRAPAATGTIHQLATHDLLAAFLRAEPPAGAGLAAWLPERPLSHLFNDYLRPDALAVLAIAGGRVTLFVERDLGTEPTKVLLGKISRYRALLARAPGVTANLGIVVESRRRARSLLSRLSPAADGSQPHVWLGVAPQLLADPYGASWEDPHGERRSTTDLPSDRNPSERVLGRLCLLEPDGLEAFDLGANLTPVLEPFLRRIQG